MSEKINFAFFGTSEEAVYVLEALYLNNIFPALIVTTPDKPAGRHQLLTSPLAKKWAENHNIKIFQPEKIDSNAIELINKIKAQMFLVVGYGKILPQKLIDLPNRKIINIHTSLLPLYRGPTPVQGPILAGDQETGVTIMVIDSQVDHGPIIKQERYLLKGNETEPELTRILFTRGGELLSEILPDWIAGKIKPVEQEHTKATYTKKLTKEDGLIDLNGNAKENYNKFRAYIAWPRTFFFQNGKRIIITEAELQDNPLDKARGKQFVIKKVLPEGRREISWEEFKKTNISK